LLCSQKDDYTLRLPPEKFTNTQHYPKFEQPWDKIIFDHGEKR